MKSESLLTAAEGADSVAERWEQSQPARESDESLEATKYTCENCGAHDFEVRYYFDQVKTFTEGLDCTCKEGQDFAAARERVVTRAHTWTGELGTDHRIDEWAEKEHEDHVEIAELEIKCQSCVADADMGDWDTESDGEFEPTGDDELWEVHCATCDHEIEFGWSHPDRGGRLWPCESADFNPWKCFPELRFVDSWKTRGWLRPTPSA